MTCILPRRAYFSERHFCSRNLFSGFIGFHHEIPLNQFQLFYLEDLGRCTSVILWFIWIQNDWLASAISQPCLV